MINLQKQKFFYCQWEVDSANNRPHKLEFSTSCLMNKLWRAPACQYECLKKKIFFFTKYYDDPFLKKKKKIVFWQKWSGCEEIQICILHIFKKKMPFEISSSKKSYFWTRIVHTNQLLGLVLIVTLEKSNFSWKCESKKIFIYVFLKNVFSLSFSYSLLH